MPHSSCFPPRPVIVLTPAIQLLESLPGIGDILAIVIEREVGSIGRFPSAPQLSSYSGTTPRVSSSGGKSHDGKMSTESNQYLSDRHCSKLYVRVRGRKGASVAIGAVARHLAESAFWVPTKSQPYREPAKVSPRQG